MGVADRPVAEVAPEDVRRLLTAEAARPAVARHRFGALSRFFDWCQETGWGGANPCLMIGRSRRPKPPPARAHFLTPAGLARLWRAADALQPVHRDLVRFLIAVPCRRGEAARMEWSHVDLSSGIWTQPSRLTKNRDPHCIRLHSLATEILRARHEVAGLPKEGLVFPAPVSGKPPDTFSDMKEALDAASGLGGWRWYDFRRSFATALGEAGMPEPVADAVLNHRQSAARGGMLGVYQRARRWPEQKRAMQVWGEVLASALEDG